MVVVLAFRLAIYLAPEIEVGSYYGYRYVASGGETYQGSIQHGLLSAWDYIHSSKHSAAEAQDQLNAAYATPEENPGWVVTDFTGSFELRKLQWRIQRLPTGRIEDQDVCTFHFIKASGGTSGAWNDSVDLPAVETALGTYWGAIKDKYRNFYHSDQYRWYKDGPAFYELNSDGTAYVPIGDNAAIRVTEVDVPGTDSTNSELPPQCAVTMTEKTSKSRHWGRWYLPAPTVIMADQFGAITSGTITTWLAAAVTFYNTCRSSSIVPVVWSVQKPERPKKPSGTLPPWPATAFEVTALQMDDIFDVQRRRRYEQSITKTSTTLT